MCSILVKDKAMYRKSFIGILSLLSITTLAFIIGCEEPLKAENKTSLQNSMPAQKNFTNSLGMEFVKIESGEFMMGRENTPLPYELTEPLSYPRDSELRKTWPNGDPDKFIVTNGHIIDGDYDEKPAHKVRLSRPFYMGIYEVTNAQYEKFDPSHKKLRGKLGYSNQDDEAVVFVNWHEAKAFCEWLSKKEGLPYRLPTEAEWEYACRAGSTSFYSTGNLLPKKFHKNAIRTAFESQDDIVPLFVGQMPANPFGLFDMHGNVEEWCEDWYGKYNSNLQVDPAGYADGDFKVTRGGSHGTNLYYLRSANRMGTLPQNKHWLIGLRVVIGPFPESKPLKPSAKKPLNQQNVSQTIPSDITKGPDQDKPYFAGPRKYVNIPDGTNGPIFSHHNHDAGITQCPNGDMLAIWYTCVEERGREVAVAASRLRYGSEQWEPASLFWDTPDRNDHCPAIWHDGEGTLYHFNGVCVAGMWSPLAIIMRTSNDSGATWSKAKLIAPEHSFRNMVGEPVLKTKSGAIIFGADVSRNKGQFRITRDQSLRGSTVWISYDKGLTWNDPGGNINGIHAGIVELDDGRLMALGRDSNIAGWMPKSVSSDMGKSWQASATPFPPISGGQRLVLMKLKEGPLFVASFSADIDNPQPVPDGTRPPRYKSKLFGALSFDDGETWPVRKIISDFKPDHMVETIDGGPVLMNENNAEPLGYLAVTQAADGVIHLISSINEYAFNIAWLKEKPKISADPAKPKSLPVRKELPFVYDCSTLPAKAREPWNTIYDQSTAKDNVTLAEGGMLEINATPDSEQLQRWSNERASSFYNADVHKGFSTEVAVQVTKSVDERGFEFGVFARGGTLTLNQYRISITRTGVYYWYDKNYVKIADGLDNHTAVHNYRLAVRDDTVVQIYRDGKLLGLGLVDLRIDWAPPARAAFIEWGLAHTNAAAILDYIAYDITGPYQPVN